MRRKYHIMAVLLLIMSLSMQAHAKDISTYKSGSLYNCSISVSRVSNGIAVSYSTSSTIDASEIGCKNIVLQENVNGKWIDINIPTGKTTNSSTYLGSSTYTGAVKGRSYRAHCTHYAIFNGTVKSVYNECDSLIY